MLCSNVIQAIEQRCPILAVTLSETPLLSEEVLGRPSPGRKGGLQAKGVQSPGTLPDRQEC